MADQKIEEYSSPLKKLVTFFRNSRDQWKAKHQEVKKSVKRYEVQTRAVERSRASWRERAKLAERELKEFKREIEELKRRRAAA